MRAPVLPRIRRQSLGSANPPLWRRPRAMMWLGLALVLFGLPLLSLPGRYILDTRDAIWFNPGHDLSQQFTVWRSSTTLGVEQHTGILVPMGVVIGLLRGLGLSIWVTERLWHGLLLFVAAAGMVGLIDHFQRRRSVLGPVTAAMLYVLTPYTFGYGIGATAVFLPYILLPTLLLVTARWLRSHSLAGPVLFGLTVFLMGGGNGAPQIYAILTVLLFGAWVVGVERSVPVRQALWFAAWSGLFVVGLNLYWLYALTSSSDVSNVLSFSEQPKVINVASSYSEAIRGLGFWAYYGGDLSGPWAPSVQRFITSPLWILTTFAVPVGAFASAWLVRWRYRLFFLFLGILATVVVAGIFPIGSPTPIGHLLLFAYAHVPGAAGLRTTYKFGGTLNLALAVLCGMGIESAWLRLRPSSTWLWRAAVAVAVIVIVANAFPLWTGQLYTPKSRSTAGIPAYWQQALRFLGGRQDGYRAFFAPATPGSVYRWGALHDGLAEATPWLPSVHPYRVPVGERYGSNLLAAIEQPYQGDIPSADAATLLRYLGVRDVVLMNDLDWSHDHTARPAELQILANDPSLAHERTFGQRGENLVGPGKVDSIAMTERQLFPVQVLSVPDPAPVVHADSGSPVLLSGDGFGLADAVRMGLFQGNPPILYTGGLTARELSTVMADHPSIVITDTNRRRAWSFSGVRNAASYTLPKNQILGDASSIAYGLFGGAVSTQTYAGYQGVSSVTASGYGSVFAPSPPLRPVNAFDGNPSTAWLVAPYQNPVGNWIQVSFNQPTALSRLTLVQPNFAFGFGRRISAATLEFSDGTQVRVFPKAGTTPLTFPAHTSAFLRVRIDAVTQGVVDNGVGFDEIQIPGVSVREALHLPTDLFDLAGTTRQGLSGLANSPLTYVFERAQTNAPLSQDEEQGIVRVFEVPNSRLFTLQGMAHLDPAVPDQAIDRVLGETNDIQATSSSRFLDAFRARASAAIDGNPSTAWIPQGTVGQFVKFSFPTRRLNQIVVHTQLAGRSPISQLRVAFSDGTFIDGNAAADGILRLRFAPRTTDFVKLTVMKVLKLPTGRTLPVGISEVSIPGVRLPHTPGGRKLGCFSGLAASVDGFPQPVQLQGTVDELLSGQSVPLSTCDGKPLSLGGGMHELSVKGVLQPDSLTLASPAPSSAPSAGQPPATPPMLDIHAVRGGGYDVDVRNATGPFYLSIGQNIAPAWRATIDGRSLGPPMLLDGYSAGWRVNRMGSFHISVAYPPQKKYDLALVISLLTLLTSLAVLGRPLLRQRKHR